MLLCAPCFSDCQPTGIYSILTQMGEHRSGYFSVGAGLLALLLIAGCAGMKSRNTAPSRDNAPTIVIIGGAYCTGEQMEFLRSYFPGSIAIVPEKYFPLWLGADAVLMQLKNKGVKGNLILIGHSWGGLIAREIDGEHPGLVKAIVTIATPSGNFRLTPDAVSDFALRPKDDNSTTPLYIIGGYKSPVRRWWMLTDESDGVIDLSSLMATGKRSVEASAIFEREHVALVQDIKVADQIKNWLAQLDQSGSVAFSTIKREAPLMSNRTKAILQWAFVSGFFDVILYDLAQETLSTYSAEKR
jgi:pimeloyl-ACP methyl ester carboxylesterase